MIGTEQIYYKFYMHLYVSLINGAYYMIANCKQILKSGGDLYDPAMYQGMVGDWGGQMCLVLGPNVTQMGNTKRPLG